MCSPPNGSARLGTVLASLGLNRTGLPCVWRSRCKRRAAVTRRPREISASRYSSREPLAYPAKACSSLDWMYGTENIDRGSLSSWEQGLSTLRIAVEGCCGRIRLTRYFPTRLPNSWRYDDNGFQASGPYVAPIAETVSMRRAC